MGGDAKGRRLLTLPEPTRQLLKRLRYTALLLEGVADHAKTERAYIAAKASAQTIYLAMDRIEDMAGILEDIAPKVTDEPRSRRLDGIREP